ncbi:MAG: hypothetical protein ACI4RJ_05910 [Alphaproteobacteria bacterium]
MKKFLLVLCIFSSVANAEISCEDAGGTLYKGNDGKTEYCLSSRGMNWWSANAWCQALGLELVDLQTECEKKTVSNSITAHCPQLKMSRDVHIVWTKNISASSKAMDIEIAGGAISTYAKTGLYKALCLVK